ncbi:MAG TPA: xyloglucanase [Actinospica sp.]|nr:xyloglucanase [Actinospica sp.]
MRTSKKRLVQACALAGVLTLPLFAAPAATADIGGGNHTWTDVTIGAGGFVTGVVYNPTQPGLAYLRTDIGGLYRWNAFTQSWTPLLDATTYANWNELGVDSVATDPIHPSRVWAAVGQYAYSWNDAQPSAILTSNDYGRTWSAFTVPFEIGSNDQGRDSGERLVVDPNDDKILYYGTENDGLWKSTDGGHTWAKDAAFPDGGANTAAGLQFVTFDQTEKHRGTPTQHIVVGDADTSSLYASTDGGATWNKVTGGPGTVPIKAQFASDGSMYVVYDQYTGPYWMGTGKLYKFAADGTATDVTPVSSWYGYDGLALDPNDPTTLYVSTNDRWNPVDTIYRSTDGGKTWADVSASTKLDISYEPYLAWGATPKFGWWIGAIAVDPFDSNHVVYGTGATLYGTYDMGAVSSGGTVDFSASASKGIEETSVKALLVPNSTTSSCKLISALGDLGGFCHTSLTQSPTDTFDTNFSTGSGIGQSAGGGLIAFVGQSGSNAAGQYSTDGGATWTRFATVPGTMTSGQGQVAVAADGSDIVWNPADGTTAVYTTDKGTTWTAVTGLPTGVAPVADSVQPNVFYGIDSATGVLYRSTDGGKTFASAATGLTAASNDQLLTIPGSAGELYLAAQTGGLLHSTDGGATWTQVDGSQVTAAYTVGSGAAAPGSRTKTLYMVGTVNGVTGFYMSTDAGARWTRINSDQQNYGWIPTIVGDPNHFGRVYLGTNGRGIQTIDLARNW